MAIDDNAVVNISRLFNEPAGHKYLLKKGIPSELVEKLNWLGFSGIANLLSAIKFAKFYELGSTDVVITVLTDSMELYGSRIKEMHEEFGQFSELDASSVFGQYMAGVTTDHMEELTYESRKRIHNLKYYTWVEQQGKSYQEIQDQWYDPNYWTDIQSQVGAIDKLITEFNHKVESTK
jgi:hypothetical protein